MTLFEVEPDPNQDLVGFEFDTEDGRLTVVRSAAWSSTYMECEGKPDARGRQFLTVRPTASLRLTKARS